MSRLSRAFCAGVAVATLALSGARASATIIDFSFEDDGVTPLANGQKIDFGQEFGVLFDVTSSGPNAGVAVFDTTACPSGPNCGGPDPDLLVGLGNALILQESGAAAMTGDFFNTPNDDASQDNFIYFDFLSPVTMQAVDLIDINGNGPATVKLIDSIGRIRTYAVGMHWTFDISSSGPSGYGTLDLTTLAPQIGEGGGVATASEVAGFDPSDVVRMSIEFDGSAGVDNLTFVPEPGTLALLAISAVTIRRRRAV